MRIYKVKIFVLKRENRLRKKKDFDAILKQRNFKKSSFILLGFKKNSLDYSRFGIIVSKKVSPKAVVRNKIKRRIREIIRNRIKMDEIKRGFDIIIMPYKEIETKSFQEIEKEVLKILQIFNLSKKYKTLNGTKTKLKEFF